MTFSVYLYSPTRHFNVLQFIYKNAEKGVKTHAVSDNTIEIIKNLILVQNVQNS